jgi:hypothetical protein
VHRGLEGRDSYIMSDFRQPVDFSEKVRRPAGKAGGYPTQIKAEDLDKNFTWCAVEFDEASFAVESTTGLGGHPTRKIKLLAPPASGTYVLGSVDGEIQWLETEDCD